MPCYRQNGCGPYANRPCVECPASRADYMDRSEHPEERRLPIKTTRFEPQSRNRSEYAFHTMAPLAPNEFTIENMRGWLNAHEIKSNCFALSLPNACPRPAGRYGIYTNARAMLIDESSAVRHAAMLAAEHVLNLVSENQNLPDPLPMIHFPDNENPIFKLTGIPEVDPVMSPDQKLIQRYNLVLAFDTACQVAWYTAMYGLTTIENLNPGPETPEYTDHDRLVKLQTQFSTAIRNITKEYDANTDEAEDMIGYLVKANIPVPDAVLMLYPIPDITIQDMI